MQATVKVAEVKLRASAPGGSGRLPRTLLFRTLTTILGLAIALTACELALRLAGWSAPGFYLSGKGPIALRDPGYKGGAFPPGVRGELRHYDYSVECVVNSYGFRDREIMPKQPGEWRIGILGDSFTAGMGVQQQDRFADIFGSGLKAARANVTVWNLGAPNCGTACEAEMLRFVNDRYQLDEIVLAFYGGNDVEDNSAWYSTEPANQPIRSKIKEWLAQHSRLATFVWINALRGWATFRPPGIYSQTDLDRLWPSTERAFQQLTDVVGTKRLTVLYLPAPPEWNDDLWTTMRSHYQVADQSRYLVKEAVSEWAREHRIDFIDTTKSLNDCRQQRDCLFPVDPHWTAKAHALVARGLLSEPRWSQTDK